ncbi:hypothetical protein GWI33_010465 [Rhynchophorus ferrugineus]|uniref:Uncharacterized protein n=1 Tax=Rhynchophorus ferrugineus TaxID=354439 RepID=A0A834I885_RHYFE|nr:hypothetical protein GWI33_010465 [Rhynchophorus ferrugineus]
MNIVVRLSRYAIFCKSLNSKLTIYQLSGIYFFKIPTSGCSRTNPIEWTGVNVKKEPGSNPCQVAEITTSMSPVVKVEVTSPTQKNDNILGNSLISSNGKFLALIII